MNLIYITGTSRGIGYSLALEMLKNPENKVVGVARNQTIKHNNYIHFNIDLADIEQIKTFKFKTPPGTKKVVLVNNAGTLGEITHFGNISADMIHKTINVNLTAALIFMNDFIKAYQYAAVPKLIINITSGAANSAYDGWGMYCASKAALDMATKVAHEEQQKHSNPIKILGIAPGVVDTEMQTQIRKVRAEYFSRKQKFIDLKEQNELYNATDVARRLKDIIDKPELVGSQLISRIKLP